MDGDGGRSKISIVADMNSQLWRWVRARTGHVDTTPDVSRRPKPGAKPRPDAQWDEAAGRWEVWSEQWQGWVSLDDGAVQAPGTPSVDPHPDSFTTPPGVGPR